MVVHEMPLLFPRFRSALRFSFSSLSAGLSTPHLYIADVTPSQLSNCPSPTVAVLSSRGSDVTYSSAKREYIPGLGQVSATYGSMAGSGPQRRRYETNLTDVHSNDVLYLALSCLSPNIERFSRLTAGAKHQMSH
ncbi:hypothetical protein T01_6156 [Trichinella spiralis]|uniref:Uncharacterized protein n=1 Tax=Trichinella spiralis TaxID=6334 RepID=A0A0V1AW20_TRISP|nr:hypothetical protein T01_6156 [Trichinella spiralis]